MQIACWGIQSHHSCSSIDTYSPSRAPGHICFGLSIYWLSTKNIRSRHLLNINFLILRPWLWSWYRFYAVWIIPAAVKKVFSFILTLLYFASTVGTTIHQHYCMGELVGISLFNTDLITRPYQHSIFLSGITIFAFDSWVTLNFDILPEYYCQFCFGSSMILFISKCFLWNTLWFW